MAFNEKVITSLLGNEDYIYLSQVYGLTVDFIQGMNDADWCAYLGCSVDELPFYLLDDEGGKTNEAFGLLDDFESFDEADTLFDLGDYIERQFAETPIPNALPPVNKIRSEYSRPSKYATQRKPKIVVTHHFELVK
jgi:hypothetical protein